MTKQIYNVITRPWFIGHVYRAELSSDNKPSSKGYDVRKGWRPTKTGIRRYIKRSMRRRARAIAWHTRNWESFQLPNEE